MLFIVIHRYQVLHSIIFKTAQRFQTTNVSKHFKNCFYNWLAVWLLLSNMYWATITVIALIVKMTQQIASKYSTLDRLPTYLTDRIRDVDKQHHCRGRIRADIACKTTLHVW